MTSRPDNGWLPMCVFHAGSFVKTNNPFYRSRKDRHNRSPSRPLRRNLHPRFLLTYRRALTLLKYLLPTGLILLLLGFYRFEPHIELAFYDRSFISKHITRVEKLAGCFDESRVSASYNLSKHVYGPKRTDLHAGMPMRIGLDCYDFAGTIKDSEKDKRERRTNLQHVAPEDKTQYHTYWRTDLAPFSPRQEWMLKSFFATQDLSTSRLILWTNGDLSQNAILQSYVSLYPDSFLVKVVDIPRLARGTALEGNELLEWRDQKAWVDGDLIRLLLLWTYGGVWVDMDSLLTRDLYPLLEHEFVTQWDCYGMCSCRFLSDPLIRLLFVIRQSLRPFQWCPDALPQAFTLSLRGLQHHGFFSSPTNLFDGLGLTSLFQTLPTPHRILYPSFQNSSILLQRRSVVPAR